MNETVARSLVTEEYLLFLKERRHISFKHGTTVSPSGTDFQTRYSRGQNSSRNPSRHGGVASEHILLVHPFQKYSPSFTSNSLLSPTLLSLMVCEVHKTEREYSHPGAFSSHTTVATYLLLMLPTHLLSSHSLAHKNQSTGFPLRFITSACYMHTSHFHVQCASLHRQLPEKKHSAIMYVRASRITRRYPLRSPGCLSHDGRGRVKSHVMNCTLPW